jgi:hypothetical protein
LFSVPCAADRGAHHEPRQEFAGIAQHSSPSTGCPSSIEVDGPPNKKPSVSSHGGPHIQPITPPKTKGGRGWKDLTVMELWAYIGILIYMGIKKEPYRQNYWSKCELLHCAVIPKVMSCRRWESVTRCLYLVDNAIVI